MIDRRSLLAAGAALFVPASLEAQTLPTQRIRRRAPDVVLESHRREMLRWRRDIVESSRTSVVGLSFVGCTSQCPALDVIFQLLDTQALPSIDLYTLTLTPLANDWRVLAGRAEELGSSPRWRWLTGKPEDVYTVLDALDTSYSDPNSHSQTVILTGRNRYDRIDAPSPERLPSAADLVAALS